MPPRSHHVAALSLLASALLAGACTPGPISNGSFQFDTPSERVTGSFSGQVAVAPLSSPSPSPTVELPTPTPEATATAEPIPTATAPPTVTATSVPPTPTVPPTATPPPSSLLPAVDMPWPATVPGGVTRPIEIQAWWHDPARPRDAFGHIHATTALPHGVASGVAGVLNVPIRAVMHNNPSRLYHVHLAMDQGNQQVNIGTQDIRPNVVCPYNGITESNCTTTYQIQVDTRQYGDGWKYVYLLVESMTPDEQVYRTSSRIPVYFKNGNPVVANPTPDGLFGTCPFSSVLGRAWYDSLQNYSDVRAVCVPQTAVSGTHRFYFAGGAGAITKSVTITLSRNHEVPAAGPWAREAPRDGQIVYMANGPHGGVFPVDIDTTRLQNGFHSLSVRTMFIMPATPSQVSVCDYCDGLPDTLEAVVKYWFAVNNP